MNTRLSEVTDPSVRPPLPPRCGMIRHDEKFELSWNHLADLAKELRKQKNKLAGEHKALESERKALSAAKKENIEICRRHEANLRKILREKSKASTFTGAVEKFFKVWDTLDRRQRWKTAQTKPKPMFPVLAVCESDVTGASEVIRAVWLPDYYQEATNFDGEVRRYDGKEYWPGGWYEWNRGDECH